MTIKFSIRYVFFLPFFLTHAAFGYEQNDKKIEYNPGIHSQQEQDAYDRSQGYKTGTGYEYRNYNQDGDKMTPQRRNYEDLVRTPRSSSSSGGGAK